MVSLTRSHQLQLGTFLKSFLTRLRLLGGWDEEMVYRYLRVEYWLDDAVADVYRGKLAEVEEEELSGDSFSCIWSGIDTEECYFQ